MLLLTVPPAAPAFFFFCARQFGDVCYTLQRRGADPRGGKDVKPGENGNSFAGERLQRNRRHGTWDFASAVQFLVLAGVHGAIDDEARLTVCAAHSAGNFGVGGLAKLHK